MLASAVHAAAYRAYAIRPYNFRKTNTAKTTFDVGKTVSYAGKIISDIIQTTSDIILADCNALKNKTLQTNNSTTQKTEIQYVGIKIRILQKYSAMLK